MTGPRTYADPCGIARALDAVGERWGLLIIRELVLGPKRFTDLRAALGASPNVLSQRLAELEAAGVVRQRAAGGALYEVTDWGRDLHPILVELGRWGARSTAARRGELSVDALVLALEATFHPESAADLRAVYELRLGEERFTLRVAGGRLEASRSSSPSADVIITADASTLRAVAFGDLKLANSEIEIRGDAALGRRFFRLFSRPAAG